MHINLGRIWQTETLQQYLDTKWTLSFHWRDRKINFLQRKSSQNQKILRCHIWFSSQRIIHFQVGSCKRTAKFLQLWFLIVKGHSNNLPREVVLDLLWSWKTIWMLRNRQSCRDKGYDQYTKCCEPEYCNTLIFCLKTLSLRNVATERMLSMTTMNFIIYNWESW